MILGVVFGTYSSIYIANPVLVFLKVSQRTIVKEEKPSLRNSLIVDEGDPLNEILNNKSISKIKSSGLFSKVDFQIRDTNVDYKKDIQINVVEQPTGEITAGAGYGSSGQTLSFGIKENNFGGNATRLNTSLSISQDTLKGGFTLNIPNYRYSDKALKLNVDKPSVYQFRAYAYEGKNDIFAAIFDMNEAIK